MPAPCSAEALTINAPLDVLHAARLERFMHALPWATAGTIVWILIAYRFHQSMIDAVTGGREVTRQEEPRLYNLLENLCISRGITMPKLKIADDPALNAFATGMNEKQYSITVTTRTARVLDDAETRGSARPRADPHPQRRRAHDGDRGHHRRRHLVLRRAGVPPVLRQATASGSRPAATTAGAAALAWPS